MNRSLVAVLTVAGAVACCPAVARSDAPQPPAASAALSGPAVQAQAEEPAASASAPADAPEVHARKLALVHRYFEAVRLDSLMDKMTGSLIPIMVAEQARENPKISAVQQKLIADTVVEAMPDFTKKIMERSAEMYATALTEEELSRMVDFYSSPVGQSIVVKSTKLTSSIGPLMEELMPQFKADFTARLCHKIDCRNLKPKA